MIQGSKLMQQKTNGTLLPRRCSYKAAKGEHRLMFILWAGTNKYHVAAFTGQCLECYGRESGLPGGSCKVRVTGEGCEPHLAQGSACVDNPGHLRTRGMPKDSVSITFVWP